MRYARRRCVLRKPVKATKTTLDGRKITLQNQAGFAEKRRLKGELFRRQGGRCIVCNQPLESVLDSVFWQDSEKRQDAIYDDEGNEIGGLCHKGCRKALCASGPAGE